MVRELGLRPEGQGPLEILSESHGDQRNDLLGPKEESKASSLSEDRAAETSNESNISSQNENASKNPTALAFKEL